MHQEELRKFKIKTHQTIRQAMEAINANWHEIVFVEDDEQRILGTITDGDIRRGLLNNFTFESRTEEIMSKKFFSVSEDINRVDVLDMMKAYIIRQIPILDCQDRLIGIHFLEELIGTSIKPNFAVIMAGGKGIRIRPITENCPKPMITVAGRPILERVILHLVGYGIRNIYIAINYLGKMIEDYFGDGTSFGCSIKYLKEEKELGTGGALSLLPEIPEHPFIVMNGDLVTQVNIGKMLEFHEEGEFDATIGVSLYQVEIPFGVVKREGNRLVELQEKPREHYLINSGIYVINPARLPLIPREEEFPIISLFENLLRNKAQIGVYPIEEEWLDVGRYEDLKKARGII